MSIQSEIDRIKANIANAYSILERLGATIPDERNSDNLPGAVNTITPAQDEQYNTLTFTLADGTAITQDTATTVKVNSNAVAKIEVDGVTMWEASTHSVTNILTHCSNSNIATTVIVGGTYEATISCTSAYRLVSTTVTMGGEDITSSAWSRTGSRKGTISIAEVTGDIVITAEAE